MMYAFMFVLAWLLLWIEYRMLDWRGGFHVNNWQVCSGVAKVPAQHRILVPFICKWLGIHCNRSVFIENSGRFIPRWLHPEYERYTLLKLALNFLMLVTFSLYLEKIGVSVMSGVMLYTIFWASTFMYDYTECQMEMVLYPLFAVFSDNLPMLIALSFVAGANRETSLFMPFVSFIMSGFSFLSLLVPMFTVFGMVYLIRGYYKVRERVVKPVMLFDSLKEWWAILVGKGSTSIYTHRARILSPYNIGLAFIVGYFIVCALAFPGSTREMMALMVWGGVYVVAISIPGIFAEFRIYLPAALPLVPAVLKVVSCCH